MARPTKRAMRSRGVTVGVITQPTRLYRAAFIGFGGTYLLSVSDSLDRRQRGRVVRRYLRSASQAEATGTWIVPHFIDRHGRGLGYDDGAQHTR